MSVVIRHAREGDVGAITALVNHYAEQNITLPRTEENVLQTLGDWVVAISSPLDFESVPFLEEDITGDLVGCGSLVALTEDLAEVRSLAIAEGQQGKGLGAKIVTQLVQLARERQFTQVCALTLTEGFFLKLGFELVDRWRISPKVWQACIYCPKFHRCDEVAVLMQLAPLDANGQANENAEQPAWIGLLKWQEWLPLKLAYKRTGSISRPR